MVIKTPGTYWIDIDGNAPLAGHQDKPKGKHQNEILGEQVLAPSQSHLEEKQFHNYAKYELK